jgi:hypothetical protein
MSILEGVTRTTISRRSTPIAGQAQQLAAVAGVLSVVLLLISGFLAPAAPSRASATSKIVHFYITNHTGLLIAGYLAGISLFLFFLFLGGLRAMLQSAEGESGTLSSAAYGAGIAFSAVALIAAGVTITAVFKVAGMGDPVLIRALYDMNHQLLHLSFIPLGALLAITSLVAVWTRVLPAWLSWAGFVIAAIALIAAAGLFADKSNVVTALSLVLFLLYAAWVLVVSAVMYRQAPQSS